jgi:DNA invertase Pin-like site-specific DNA recombinase
VASAPDARFDPANIKIDVNRARVEALIDDGLSVRETADETGISKSTVHRIKKAIETARGNDDAE